MFGNPGSSFIAVMNYVTDQAQSTDLESFAAELQAPCGRVSKSSRDAAARLKNGSCEDDGPSQVKNRAAALGVKEGNSVVPTVKDAGV
jgi:hypothetical protein